eukprot:scaffold304_cov216-Alexandrium_tamarense.AAC.4
MTIIIELFLCVTFLILIYQCCIKGARARPSPHDHLPDGISDNPVDVVREDLEQFRRLRRNSVENQSGDAVAARKELIKMNLFSRQICREESVKELSQILAISRGGGGRSVLDTDEEMGLCTVEGQEENSANDEVDIDLTNTPHELSAGKAATQADADLSTVATTSTAFPSPSAPSISTTDAVVTAIHDVQTTQSTLQETTQISNADPHAIPTLGPLRQLWTSWTHNNEKNHNKGSVNLIIKVWKDARRLRVVCLDGDDVGSTDIVLRARLETGQSLYKEQKERGCWCE